MMLDEQRAKGKRPTKRVVHLFAGLTYCGCGHKMYVPSNSPKYICSHCRNKMPVEDLDAVFHEQLRNFFFSSEEIAHHLEEADLAMREKEELLGVLEKERTKLQAEVDKLYDLYQSGSIDKHGFGAKYHPLSERGRQLDDEIPKAQAELDVMKIAHLSQEEIIAEARDLYSRWPSLPHEEKRRIVEAITERIIIGDGDVEINLYYAPLPPSATPVSGGATDGSGTPPASAQTHGKRATKPHGCIAASTLCPPAAATSSARFACALACRNA